MRYHIVFKFFAILLCACCLLVSVGAGIGIFALVESGLYHATVEELQAENREYRLRYIAEDIVRDYVMENFSNLPPEAKKHYFDGYGYTDRAEDTEIYYSLCNPDGEILDTHVDATVIRGLESYPVDVYATFYPTVLEYQLLDPYTGNIIGRGSEETLPPGMTATQDAQIGETTPTTATFDPSIGNTAAPGDGTYEYFENWGYEDETGMHRYRLGMRYAPKYRVTLYLTENLTTFEDHWSWELAEFGYAHRYHVIWILGVSLLLFAAVFTYLCCAAGKKPKTEEVCPGGFNRLPLDLYGAGVGLIIMCLVILGWDLVRHSFGVYASEELSVLLVVVMAFVACLLTVAFLFACAAQFKMKYFYWARHSLIGMVLVAAAKLCRRLLRKLGTGGKWFSQKFPPAGKKLFEILKNILIGIWTLFLTICKTIWAFIYAILRFIGKNLQRFSQLLPLTWQWLLVGLGMIFVLLFCMNTHNAGAQFLGIAFCICLIMYGAHCFGVLLESTKRMSKGDLDTKVDDKLLLGGFKEYATDLNALADVAVEAAKQQMKSERMKAELVTNVSHDIKTPLTSIINYVDLLQRAENQEQAEAYVQVLARQSQRLKKLIEDLMEMSKASTGNMAVNLMTVNAVETINQALGEFSEKLEKAQLIPVFNPPVEPVMMTADGRLTWRVLSNLLGNAVKYALPGTRLYIDLIEVNDQVLISLKNISREQLNVSTDELMERFVRGDASRNTEGSGLGLNIAKSLMELQKGQLQLLVDGDLFKATLIFPKK